MLSATNMMAVEQIAMKQIKSEIYMPFSEMLIIWEKN